MPIIFISGLPFGGGERLARMLAEKLGYDFLGRDDVVARANECGIPVGKLEVAMVKKPAVQERMARLRDRYIAVATDSICERAARGDLVYYGRAGHHLLQGVGHVMRVRVVPDAGRRLETVMERLKLSREKAEKFIGDIDSDIRAWVNFVHGWQMDDPQRYDFVVNLEHVSLENAAVVLCGMAELPDFRPTPASRKAMEERLLQSRARIKLALDERTAGADLTVRSLDGVLTITYMPRQSQLASVIPEVIGDLPGCREIRCTMAGTNILWVQEEFDAGGESFRQVNELARRWGAAVELLRYTPSGPEDGAPQTELPRPERTGRPYDGGIEDDVQETVSSSERALRQTIESLVREGRSGGGQAVSGARENLLAAVNPSIPYSLVVVGDLYLQKPAAARTRMTRELSAWIGRHVKAPVISISELGERLRFTPAQALKIAAALAVVVLVYVAVFMRQGPLLDMLGGAYHKSHPWVAPVIVAIVAPLVAALYGKVAGALLKLIKLE